jgi:hypothetical protein
MRFGKLGILFCMAAGVSRAAAPPVCNGTVTYCRPCTAADDGQTTGCTGPTPVCETNEESARFGSCVECTSDANCALGEPVCTIAGPSADSCSACSTAADCSINPAGTDCLPSGACGTLATLPPATSLNSSCSSSSAQPSCLTCILLLSVLFRRLPSRPLTLVTRSVANALRQASPSRSPASEAMRSAKR